MFLCLSLQFLKGFFVKYICLFIVALVTFLKIDADESYLYFTSEVDVAKKFIERVGEEKQSIKLAAHRLSQVEVIESLIEAHRRNVLVEVIVDSVTITKNTPLSLLVKEGISVFVWNQESFPKKKNQSPGRLHHSFCVFGLKNSWTGSYSFSLKSKFHHFENALFVSNEKVAKAFSQEFEEIKKNHTMPFSLPVEKKSSN